MFAKFLRIATLGFMVAGGAAGALVTAAASSAPASAQTIGFEFRFGDDPHVRHYRHIPPRYARDYCNPRQAVHKARRMGVHRARVVRNAPRRVAVAGFDRGHRVRVVFANRRGCPVIGWR